MMTVEPRTPPHIHINRTDMINMTNGMKELADSGINVDELIEKKIKVKQWSFCLTCKGEKCKACGYKGVIIDSVLLEDIQVEVRPRYIMAQENFVRLQLRELKKAKKT